MEEYIAEWNKSIISYIRPHNIEISLEAPLSNKTKETEAKGHDAPLLLLARLVAGIIEPSKAITTAAYQDNSNNYYPGPIRTKPKPSTKTASIFRHI